MGNKNALRAKEGERKRLLVISVSNGYIVGWNSGHYIGRGGKGKNGSALANPFRLQDTSNETERDIVIAKYRSWLWQKIQQKDSAITAELNYLKQQALVGDVNLLCFCKQPTREVACHGDVIKSCLEWMLQPK